MGHIVGRLVGRGEPLNRLSDAVARARTGARTCVIIEGDAGIGKSRLLTEALAQLRNTKDAVGLGYGVELVGGELPYGLVSGTLRSMIRELGADPLRSAAGEHATALAPLCPDLAPGGDGTADRVRLLPAFVATIENLANERLVWLIIEDLPWLDASSKDLLAYLVRVAQRCQLLILVTVRTHDPDTEADVTDLVDTLAALDGVERFALGPLASHEASALIGDLTANSATPRQEERLLAGGQGNPLLIEQLVAAGLDDEGAPVDTVSHPVLTQLRRLTPDARHLMQIAALGEGHLSHRLLEQVILAPESSFDAAVDEVLAAGMLEYRPKEREYRFRHALVRQAIEDTLTPAQRLNGHLHWARVLSEPANHTGEGRFLVAAAQHWAETDAQPETFTAALRAARVTTQLGSPDETSALLVRAWHLWDQVPDPTALADCSRDDLLIDTWDALDAAERPRDAVTLVERELAVCDGDDRLRRLCLRLILATVRETLGENADELLYADAVRELDVLTDSAATRLIPPALHAVGWYLQWSDPEQSFQVHRRAMEVSAELGHPADSIYATSMVAYQLSLRGRHSEALDLLRPDLEESAIRVNDRVFVETIRADCLGRAGRFREAATRGEKALARVTDPRLAPAQWPFTVLRTCEWLNASGEWDRVAYLRDQLLHVEIDDWMASTWVLAAASSFACHRGDPTEAARLANLAWDKLPPEEDATILIVRDSVRLALAEVAATRGEYDRAREILDPLVRHPGIDAFGDLWPVVAAAARIEGDRLEAGDPTIAPVHDALEIIDSAAERLPRGGDYYAARYLHARADLARAERADTAEIWIEVRDSWRGLGQVPLTGWSSLRLAKALIDEDHRAAAKEPLAEAWDIARRLDAKPLQDATVGLSRRARVLIEMPEHGTERPVTGRLARLTTRELEVLEHVAAGESNDELAAALFISPKTASVHVSRILAKLDVKSRSKATAVALEEGLRLKPH